MRAGPHLQPLLSSHINQALESSTGLQGMSDNDHVSTCCNALIGTVFQLVESCTSRLYINLINWCMYIKCQYFPMHMCTYDWLMISAHVVYVLIKYMTFVYTNLYE